MVVFLCALVAFRATCGVVACCGAYRCRAWLMWCAVLPSDRVRVLSCLACRVWWLVLSRCARRVLVLFGALLFSPSHARQWSNVNRDLHRYNIYNRYNVNIYMHLCACSAPVPCSFCTILCALVCILGVPGVCRPIPHPYSPRAIYLYMLPLHSHNKEIYICIPCTIVLGAIWGIIYVLPLYTTPHYCMLPDNNCLRHYICSPSSDALYWGMRNCHSLIGYERL